MVPKRRFELLQGCPHQNLNLARLPVPPLRQNFGGRAMVAEFSGRVKTFPGASWARSLIPPDLRYSNRRPAVAG